ncbi:hypothetical protein FOA43_004424 [Brettanomyces nanus]|uniref:6-O-methylguanine-DNA methyltransferase n=1 Tax=Eeniella nana TaxID=13502 RepID=A0A875RXS7_EENNA|nr:uncharacterized protein FOA43_004424 [Brettanomyces nanus]QPG77027.1 hypothetical protein FOA43_004424 [Brettanomyces nanus]
MPKIPTDEQLTFHYAVYSKILQIPKGHVTSYGQISRLIHCPRNARQVGMSLKHMDYYVEFLRDTNGDQIFDLSLIPWWRVINSQGTISKRDTDQAVLRQVQRLTDEDVEVEKFDWTSRSRPPSSWTPYHVDFQRYGWFPEVEDEDEEENDHTQIKVEDTGELD